MANPTTLTEFAQLARNTYAMARTGAQTALAGAQAELAAARTSLEDHTKQLAAKDEKIAEKRRLLATTDVPADADALLDEIATLQAEARGLQGDILDDNTAITTAQARADAASSALAKASAELAASEAELVAVTEGGTQRAGWRAAVAVAPLVTLRSDATTALAGSAFNAARARITAGIPAKLVAAVRKSHQVETARVRRLEAAVATAEDLLADEQETNGGLVGLVEKRQMEMERAERAMREWVERGRERYSRAVSLLEAVMTGDSLLTAAETAKLADVDIADAGGDGADSRSTRDDARRAAFTAEADWEDAVLTARAPDPNADVSAVAAVQTARTTADTARGTLSTAQGAYDGLAVGYVTWAAAVPDPVWRRVIGFVEAEEVLRELSDAANPDGVALATALANAERDLAGALADAERSAITLAFLEDQLALREARLTEARASLQTRVLSSVRGDA